MKRNLRMAVLAASLALSLSIGLGAFPASAATNRSMVRTAQIRLGDLGYFNGFYDGVLGSDTRTAIKKFQHHVGIPATGKLTPRTYNLIQIADYKIKHGIGINPEKHVDSLPPETWHYVKSVQLPIRSGNLVVDEEAKGSTYRYTVKLNGKPFLLADNQPETIRISEIFHLAGEDALIITAWRGETSCRFQNYLVTVHADGTQARKHEFQSCAPSSSVQSAHNALFVRFAETMNKDGYDRWDVWRYEDTRLVRL